MTELPRLSSEAIDKQNDQNVKDLKRADFRQVEAWAGYAQTLCGDEWEDEPGGNMESEKTEEGVGFIDARDQVLAQIAIGREFYAAHKDELHEIALAVDGTRDFLLATSKIFPPSGGYQPDSSLPGYRPYQLPIEVVAARLAASDLPEGFEPDDWQPDPNKPFYQPHHKTTVAELRQTRS